MNDKNSHPRSCPCKRLPLSISSFTAAEYGNVAALTARAAAAAAHGYGDLALRRDGGGNTPLHLAAQHGQVAACLVLLQQQASRASSSSSSSSSGADSIVNSSAGGATPLHRASFSGAAATMRLLVQDPRCHLLARDSSFGDIMTPLHKAASGGRYLAVQLLLKVLAERQLLDRALTMKDARGMTPWQVAEEKAAREQEEEAASVARWNQVAGGPPDWNKCAELLRGAATSRAGGSVAEGSEGGTIMTTSASATGNTDPPDKKMIENSYLNIDVSDELQQQQQCINCENCSTTATWEAAFHAALSASVDHKNNTQSNEPTTTTIMEKNPLQHPLQYSSSSLAAAAAAPNDGMTPTGYHEEAATSSSSAPAASPPGTKEISLGRACDACHKICMALFPKNGLLVCRNCRQRRIK